MAGTNNFLEYLRQIDPDVTKRLRPMSFKRSDMLAESGQTITDVCFPVSGMISLVVELRGGGRIEAGTVGYQDVLGGGAAFGQTTHLTGALGQIPGEAMVMSARDLAALAQHSPEARRVLHAHEQLLRVQAQQTAACNARHHIPARLATWLLRARDTVGGLAFDITQEFAAEMLGVQRASVSIIASELQDARLIYYRRGHMKVIDEAGLEEKACECYRAIERARAQLFPDSLAATPSAVQSVE